MEKKFGADVNQRFSVKGGEMMVIFKKELKTLPSLLWCSSIHWATGLGSSRALMQRVEHLT